MIAKTLASVLCLILSPLLPAQQIGQAEEQACEMAPTETTASAETLFAYRSSMNRVDFTDKFFQSPGIPDSLNGFSLSGLSVVPFEKPVELTLVDPEAWANATIGSTLKLRVVQDVIEVHHQSKYADVYAGTLIEAKVIRIREGKPRIRHGKEEPRVKEILVGKRIKLELESSPKSHARLSSIPKKLIAWPVDGATFIIIIIPVYVLLGIACMTGCDL